MNISKTFRLEDPSIDLAWGLNEEAFREHFTKRTVTQITVGHLARCRLLEGLETDVHFHFKPRQDGRFFQVEIYRKPQRHRQKAFDEWQTHLVTVFLPCVAVRPTLPIQTRYEWDLEDVTVAQDW